MMPPVLGNHNLGNRKGCPYNGGTVGAGLVPAQSAVNTVLDHRSWGRRNFGNHDLGNHKGCPYRPGMIDG